MSVWVPRALAAAGAALAVVWSGCAGGGGTPIGPEIRQAADRIAAPGTAFKALGAGDGAAARWYAVEDLLPDATTLIDADAEATAHVASRLAGSHAYLDDSALLAFCYILAERDDGTARAALGEFLESNVDGDLLWSLDAAAEALEELAPAGNPHGSTVAFTVDEMLEAAARAAPSALGRARAWPGAAASCVQSYRVKDAAGGDVMWDNPESGRTEPLSLELRRWNDLSVGGEAGQRLHDEIAAGGGAFVPGAFGTPSKFANCAGYAVSRTLDAGVAGSMSPATLQTRLLGAMLITGPIAPSAAREGDLVFWEQASGTASHVAVVDEVPLLGQVQTIQKDNWSGVFRAAIGADYFNEGRAYGEPRIYRYQETGLQLELDDSKSGHPGYCQNTDIVIR